MILYTDLDTEYFHFCTTKDIKERISWCYKKFYSSDNFLHCSYSDCEFRFPSILVINSTAYSIFRISPYTYVNFKSGTNNKYYLETLRKIEV